LPRIYQKPGAYNKIEYPKIEASNKMEQLPMKIICHNDFCQNDNPDIIHINFAPTKYY
jgi:hypothetical protein